MDNPVSTFLRFLFRFLKSIFNFIFSIYIAKEYWFSNKTDGSKENIPKIIWMYWESEKPNHLVDYCIENTKNICSEYEVVILNSSNIHNYIDMPNLYEKKLKKAILADYIRLALLKKYGGIWMDASIFITQDFSWFLDKLDKNSNFLFYSDQCTTNNQLPIFENWFIAAPQNSLLITDWFSEFEKCILSSEPTKYYEAVTGEDFIQKIPNTDYLMCYIAIAKVTSHKKYNIVAINSGAVGHYYNYKLYSNSFLMALALMWRNKKHVFNPYMIKFTKDTRAYPNLFIKYNLLNKYSLLSRCK